MLKVKIKNTALYIPESFEEVSPAQWLLIESDPTPRGAIQSFFGHDATKIKNLDAILELVNWLFDESNLNDYEFALQLENEAWGKEIQLRQLIADKPYPWLFGYSASKIYRPKAPNYFLGTNLMRQLIELHTNFAELHNVKETDDTDLMRQAGAGKLEAFGDFLIIDKLANGDPLRYDELSKLPARVIYFKMLLNKVHGEVEQEYIKLKKILAQ